VGDETEGSGVEDGLGGELLCVREGVLGEYSA